jgi:hypothetical protein
MLHLKSYRNGIGSSLTLLGEFMQENGLYNRALMLVLIRPRGFIIHGCVETILDYEYKGKFLRLAITSKEVIWVVVETEKDPLRDIRNYLKSTLSHISSAEDSHSQNVIDGFSDIYSKYQEEKKKVNK